LSNDYDGSDYCDDDDGNDGGFDYGILEMRLWS
jgi:hypothetical protein